MFFIIKTSYSTIYGINVHNAEHRGSLTIEARRDLQHSVRFSRVRVCIPGFPHTRHMCKGVLNFNFLPFNFQLNKK